MSYKISSWQKVSAEAVDSQVKQQVYTTDSIMLVRYLYDKGIHFPEHSHPQEQTTIVEEGELIYTVDGEEVILRTGEILTIPPNVRHSTSTPENQTAVALSIFTPVKDKVVIEE